MSRLFEDSFLSAAAAGFVSKIGLASGPLVAGQLLGSGGDYGLLINVAIATFVLSAIVMLFPARSLDRSKSG